MRERRPGVWELVVDVGTDPATGRRRQMSRTIRGGKRTAESRLAALVAEAEAGQHRSTAGTVDGLLDAWLEVKEAAGRSPTTMRTYRQVADLWVRPAIGALPVTKVTVRRLDQLYASVSAAGRSANTVAHVHAVVRGALNQALRWGWITSNPALATTRPHVPKAEIAPPTVAQLRRLLAQAAEADEDLGRMLVVAVALGARRGELCGLRWADVDLEAATVRIRRAVVDVRGEVIVKDTKTHQARTVDVDAGTVAVLERHRAEVELRAATHRCTIGPDSYVWSRMPDGSEPLRPELVTKAYSAAAIAVGLCREVDGRRRATTRLHDLRHLNATLQLAAGVPVATVSERLGHAKQSTTLDIYNQVMPGSGKDAARRLGELLGPEREEGPSLPRGE